MAKKPVEVTRSFADKFKGDLSRKNKHFKAAQAFYAIKEELIYELRMVDLNELLDLLFFQKARVPERSYYLDDDGNADFGLFKWLLGELIRRLSQVKRGEGLLISVKKTVVKEIGRSYSCYAITNGIISISIREAWLGYEELRALDCFARQ